MVSALGAAGPLFDHLFLSLSEGKRKEIYWCFGIFMLLLKQKILITFPASLLIYIYIYIYIYKIEEKSHLNMFLCLPWERNYYLNEIIS